MSIAVRLIPIFDDNYVFVIQSGADVVLVDPGDAEPLLKILEHEKLTLKGILITHHHHDHIGGLVQLQERYPHAPVWAPLLNRGQIPSATDYISDGDIVCLLDTEFQVIGLPGHTLGHVGYYAPDHQWLFSGDVLFGLGCGRIFEGTFEQQYGSLQKIRSLPAETSVFCTHEYTETNLRFLESLGALVPAQHEYARRLTEVRSQKRPSVPLFLKSECESNPFLLADNLADFTNLRQKRNQF